MGTSTLEQRHPRPPVEARPHLGPALRRGDRVGLLMNNRLEWVESFFGVTMLGAVVVARRRVQGANGR